MTNLRRSIAFALVAVSTASAAAQSPPVCVELGTAMRNVSTSRVGESISTYSCVFDRQTVTQNCKVISTLATGLKLVQTTAQTWTSVADMVDQYKVSPPLNYSLRMITGGEGSPRTTTYTYDGRKRVVREDNVSPGARSTLTWSEWDAQGRPTKGKWSGDPAPYLDTDTITYDDSARTLHRVMTGAGATTQDIEFDPQGRGVKVTAQSSGGRFVANMILQTTEKICK